MTGPHVGIVCGVIAAAVLGLASASVAQDAAAPGGQAAVNVGATFALVYRAGPSWRPGVPMRDQGLRDHFYYIRDLHENGAVLLAGPFGDDGGLILLRAGSQDAADDVMAADPAIVSGIFVGEAKPFTPRFAIQGWPDS